MTHDIALQANATGQVVRCEVEGSIKMNTLLSGMPELRLGLNDIVLFENNERRNVLTHFI